MGKEGKRYPIFIDGIGLPFVVVLFVEAVFLDPLADVDGLERDRRLVYKEVSMSGFASAWSAGEDDDWAFGHIGGGLEK